MSTAPIRASYLLLLCKGVLLGKLLKDALYEPRLRRLLRYARDLRVPKLGSYNGGLQVLGL